MDGPATHPEIHLLRALSELAQDSLIEVDASGTLLFANPAFLSIVGENGAATLGRPLWEWIHPEDARSLGETFQRAAAQSTPQPAQFRVRSADGRWRDVAATVAPCHDAEGRTHTIGILHTAVAGDTPPSPSGVDAEIQMREAVALAGLATWTFDQRTGAQTWSDENYRLLGYVPHSIAPSFEAFLSRVHPEDRPLVEQTFHVVLTHGVGTAQFRILLPDGSLRYMAARARLLRDADGTPTLVLGVSQDVTEREQAIRRLRESETHLTEAQRLARLGNWSLDLVHNHLVWSDEVFRIFEVSPRTPPLSYEGFLALVHPDDRDLVDQTYRHSIETRQPYLITHRLLFPNGSVKWVEEIGQTEFADDGSPLISRGTVQDVTERIALQADADRFAHELARVVNASPLPMVTIDDRGIIVSANPSTTQAFGWSVEELIGRNVATLAASVSEAEHHSYLQRYLETGEASTPEGLVIDRTREVRARRADGTEFPAQLTVAEIAQPGVGRRFVGILMDLTEWRSREDQLLRMQKLDALGTLVAGVSHDFNNLLTAIHGGLTLATDQPGEPRWLRIAIEATDRASALVQQLLRYSRQEPTTFAPVSVRDVVENVIALARETMDRRVWFDFEAPPPVALPEVQGDPGQIEQAILNLLVNARDAVLERAEDAPAGYRPTVRVSVQRIARSGSDGVAITVEDNGIGMTDEIARKAFDPFFTTKPADRGTGLGLAMVNSIVDSHSGAVDVSTRLHQGTQITIWLPVRSADRPAQPNTDAAAGGEHGTAHATRRIIVVDDEVLIGQIAETYLTLAGYDTQFIHGGQAAIDSLRTNDFDLAVLDLNMPAPDGWEVLAAILREKPGVPVIIASGFADASEVIRRGAVALIEKPYTRDQLLDTVEAVLAGAL